MSLKCASASSQAINNATITAPAYPFTVGCWYYFLTNAANAHVWSFSDTATTNNYYGVRQRSSGEIAIVSRGGGTELADSITSPLGVAGTWIFTLARFINATNRRLSAIYGSGAPGHIQSTTSRTATGIDNARIGGLLTTSALEYLDGSVAEWWYTNTDIQVDGAQIDGAMLRQLAYGGPFSVPHIASSLIEYRSLRQGSYTSEDKVGETYLGNGLAQQAWTLVGAPVIGEHPPLPYWYVKPGQDQRFLTV